MPRHVIEWSAHFETGVASVDAQHRRLIELANELGDAIVAQDDARCGDFCAELERYAREHFADEEACLARAAVPPKVIARHRELHAGFSADLERILRTGLPKRDTLKAVHRFTLSWLTYHILQEDKPVCAVGGRALRSDVSADPEMARFMVRTLLDAIHNLYGSLSATNQGLEQQVHRRTEELAQANARLQQEKLALEATLDELRDTQARLLHSEKMAAAGQLAAGVAHEINNPAGFVRSNLATLRDYAGDLLEIVDAYAETAPLLAAAPETQAALQKLCMDRDLPFIREDLATLLDESEDGLQRITRIVRNLLDYARPGSQGRLAVDIHDEIDSTLGLVGHLVLDKAEVRREYGVIPPVVCCPSALNQVFTNVLVNAAQAICKHGLITVRTGTSGQWAWIEIADDGVGIEPENLPRVFEPFFTTKPVGKGTGLGMSVSWGIVRDHGGQIHVDSQPGAGTTVRIELPLHAAAADTAAPSSSWEPHDVRPCQS
jgi:hemerythrin-like metal-binding protein